MYRLMYTSVVDKQHLKKRLSVTDFREQCLHLFDEIPSDGIVITKRGKPIAKVIRLMSSCSELIGTVPNLASGDDDLFSTGLAWDAESRYAHID